MARFPHRAPLRGSALITTMLVIVVLSIIVTAFLQSMTLERQTARSYMNRYRATLAAQAAANQCQNLMTRLFQTYPDSCTAWTTFPDTRGTTFYYRTLKGSENAALPKDTATGAIDLRALPLISGATSQLITNLKEDQVFPDGLTTENSTDLNRKDWIGSLAGQTTPQTIRAQWVDMLEDPSLPRDDTYDPKKGRSKNGAIARYAFWIEDDSFRVNVNVSGATPRGGTTAGSGPAEIDLEGTTAAAGTDDIAQKIVTLRESLPNKEFLTASQVNYADPGKGDYEKLNYYITTTSKALNFSRGGVQRLDLNKVVSDTTDPTAIHDQIARIIAAVGNKFAMPDLSTPRRSASDFGQRFFHRGSAPTALNATGRVGVTATFNYPDIYMQKLAANIRDYIDTDSQPTIVNNDTGYTVRPAQKPDASSMIGFDPPGNGGSASDTIAVGKEAVPALQEYALRVKLNKMTPYNYSKTNSAGASYDMEESHYFEFFNPTTKAIKVSDLGTAPFLLIANQLYYDAGGSPYNDIPHRVTEIPLSDFVDGSGATLKEFPAGTTTVLTTDTSPEPGMADGVDVTTFYRPSPTGASLIEKDRHFTGTTNSHTSTRYRLLPKFGTSDDRAGTGSTDYDTHVLIGNSAGVIESFTALPIPETFSVRYEDGKTTLPDSSQDTFRGGSLKGNNGGSGAAVATGDARSLNEQLSIRRYGGNTSDVTRFLNTSLSKGPANRGPSGNSATFGAFSYADYVDPPTWPDYAPKNINGASSAFARIANAKLDSIGQLGDIYDPMREAGPDGIDYARGGGRSLRIGQSELYTGSPTGGPDGQWDGNQDSISRNRAAWRLADVFSTNPHPVTPGLININGVSRDKGAALRAALYQLTFGGTTSDDPALGGKALALDNLITAIQERFPSLTGSDATKDNPFWERGEVSEVKSGTTPILNAGSSLAGADMKTVLDRGREELVRRTMELITTKGSVYRAYCVGEALATNQQGKTRVLSHQLLKVTFELVPIFQTPLPADDAFDPVAELDDNAPETTKRFRQPDSYQINVLSVDAQ